MQPVGLWDETRQRPAGKYHQIMGNLAAEMDMLDAVVRRTAAGTSSLDAVILLSQHVQQRRFCRQLLSRAAARS